LGKIGRESQKTRRSARGFPLHDPPINHSANFIVTYEAPAELRNPPLEDLAKQAEANFHRLFGGL